MAKQNQREKMSQEIGIHRSLSHKHVVGFKGFFEDNLNVYIILELCRRRVSYFHYKIDVNRSFVQKDWFKNQIKLLIATDKKLFSIKIQT